LAACLAIKIRSGGAATGIYQVGPISPITSSMLLPAMANGE
jgi:hypothetical protein